LTQLADRAVDPGMVVLAAGMDAAGYQDAAAAPPEDMEEEQEEEVHQFEAELMLDQEFEVDEEEEADFWEQAEDEDMEEVSNPAYCARGFDVLCCKALMSDSDKSILST